MLRSLFIPLLFFLSLQSAMAADFLLDPGHSPLSPGTASCSGGLEYQYNENLVDAIVRSLKKQGIHVDVTRARGTELSLQKRAQKSRGKKFFLSIHHDSAQPQFITQIQGNPCSEKGKGFSLFVSEKNPEYAKSLIYARILGDFLLEEGLRPSTHHGEKIQGENRFCLDESRGIYQFDNLIVLKNAKCPAVLLEAAVIIHPQEDRMARSIPFQNRIARAISSTLRAIEALSEITAHDK